MIESNIMVSKDHQHSWCLSDVGLWICLICPNQGIATPNCKETTNAGSQQKDWMAYRSPLNSSDSQDPGWWVSQENSPEFHQTWDVEIFQSCSLGCTINSTINRTWWQRFLQSLVDPFRCQHSIGDIGVTRLYVRPGFLRRGPMWSLDQWIARGKRGKPNDYNIKKLSARDFILVFFA